MCTVTETEESSRKLGSFKFGPPRRPAPAEQRPGWPSVGGVTVDDSGPPEKNDRAEQAQGSSLLLSLLPVRKTRLLTCIALSSCL